MLQIQVNGINKQILTATVFTAPYQYKESVEYAVVTEQNIECIEIHFDCDIHSITIRPLRYDIDYKIIDLHTVAIYPKGHCNFSVEPNGDIHKSVLIFAGMADAIDKDDYENIVYFESGRHFIDTMLIEKDNTLVYIEEGAILDGRIIAQGINHLAFDGYGAVSYEKYSNRVSLLSIEHCCDVEIRNIHLKDSTNWNVRILGCDRVHINNVKVIGYHGNSDGFDICGSRNVTVENCFTRVWDDSLVVKGFDTGDVYNIQFRDCVLWNDFARPMELGVEIRTDRMHNIIFEDIDVIHSVTRYPIMGIHHGDRAEVYNVVFRNINIEHTPGAQIFDLRIIPSAWNTDCKMGRVHDILFENINVLNVSETQPLLYHSRVSGFSEENNISDVTFRNISIYGKTARNTKELGLHIYDYVSNIVVEGDEAPFIDKIETKIDAGNYSLSDGGYYSVKVAVTFCNTSELEKNGKCHLKLSPAWICDFLGEITYDLKPKGSYVVEKEIFLPPGKFAFSLDGNDADLDCYVEFLDLPLILGDDFCKSPSYKFSDSYGNSHSEDVSFAIKNNILMIKTDLLKKYDITIYGAKCCERKAGDILFSIEDTNSGTAPAILLGKNGECMEGPQIGCPEEIAFVFKNYPHVDIASLKIRKKTGGVAYVPLSCLELENCKCFLMELVLHDDSDKRYDYSLFGSPIPKETIRSPRVMAHMFITVQAV